jgi:hypothetical protein
VTLEKVTAEILTRALDEEMYARTVDLIRQARDATTKLTLADLAESLRYPLVSLGKARTGSGAP